MAISNEPFSCIRSVDMADHVGRDFPAHVGILHRFSLVVVVKGNQLGFIHGRGFILSTRVIRAECSICLRDAVHTSAVIVGYDPGNSAVWRYLHIFSSTGPFLIGVIEDDAMKSP